MSELANGGASEEASAPKRSSDPNDSTFAKRPKTNDEEEILDLARCMELAPGARLKVQWNIVKEGGESIDHWWGATLLEYDGRTHDGIAIRVLEYDSFEEGGFTEKSKEDVIFIANDCLVNLPSEEHLSFMVLADDNSEVFFSTAEEVEDIVDGILASALEKASAGFNALPRSRQVAIADTIARKKEKLLDLIREHLSKHQVLTEENVRDLMAQTVSDN